MSWKMYILISIPMQHEHQVAYISLYSNFIILFKFKIVVNINVRSEDNYALLYQIIGVWFDPL